MPFPHSKTTYVRPLCESNNSGNTFKGFKTPVQPFSASDYVTSPGMYPQLEDNLKQLDEKKAKQLDNLNSAHSKLFSEIEEIQKWKTEVEMKSRQKDKKVEELTQTIDSQRKVILDLQLQNENISYKLSEENQQRSFVLENLHSTKELCSAIKKHYNALQGQFDYRNKIEDMINVANTKRLNAIEDLENKFGKICIEHSERVGLLNDALATETNQVLNLKDALTLYDNEKQSLCAILSNAQLEVKKLSKDIEEETEKSRRLFQDKCELEVNLLKIEKTSDRYLSTIKEMEQNIETLEENKKEMENKYTTVCLQNKEISQKYNECYEAAECLKLESEENIVELKQTIENLEFRNIDLLKSVEAEKQTNKELLLALENSSKEKCKLDKVIAEVNNEIKLFEKLKIDQETLKEKMSELLKENAELGSNLENARNELSKCKNENESFAQVHEEDRDLFAKLREEYESNMLMKEKELINMKEKCDELLLKSTNLEDDIVKKCDCILNKDTEIKSLQHVIKEYEQVFDSLKNDNAKLKEDFEVERSIKAVCLECESVKEKLIEMEVLKNDLKNAEKQFQIQKRHVIDTMRMLNEAEKMYNGDRIAKEKELIQYKNQLRQAEEDMKFNYIEKEIYNNLNSENKILKEDVKELEARLKSEVLQTTEVFKNQNNKLKEDLKQLEIKLQKLNTEDSSTFAKTTMVDKEESKEIVSQEHDNKDKLPAKRTNKKNKSPPKKQKTCNEAKKMNVNGKNKRDKVKNKELIKICVAKFKNRISKENENASVTTASPQKVNEMDVSVEPEKPINREVTNASSSDTSYEMYEPKATQKEDRRWEMDSASSGSEYMDISFYKQQEAMKSSQISAKPSTPNGPNDLKNKPLFGYNQKRDNTDIFSENTVTKKTYGGTPLQNASPRLAFKSQLHFKDSIWTQPMRSPEKPTGTPNLNINRVNSLSTPIITPQRRFFKTSERDEKFKKPRAKLPWF